LHPARLRRVPSLHHCSRGRRTRAVPGPLRLSPHPCGSLPSTTIPLGLLMGRLASSVRLVFLEAQQTVGAGLPAMLLLWPFRSAFQKPPRRRGLRIPSGGRVEVLWRGGLAWMPKPREVERSETRMPGTLSLWLLSARVKRYAAKRSNSRRLARRVSAANQVTRRKGETST
jgi:hypothetical protein